MTINFEMHEADIPIGSVVIALGVTTTRLDPPTIAALEMTAGYEPGASSGVEFLINLLGVDAGVAAAVPAKALPAIVGSLLALVPAGEDEQRLIHEALGHADGLRMMGPATTKLDLDDNDRG